MNYIVTLNWNGAADTIECIKSLYAAEGEFCCIIVDNGSEDDSVHTISNFLKSTKIDFTHIQPGGNMPDTIPTRTCLLLETGENYGFAKGNNYALEKLTFNDDDRILLLNNDTIVEPDFLSQLIRFSEKHPEYDALTPLICYFQPNDMVWNCGGQQKLGIRKYYYAKENIKSIKEEEYIDITFVTGCALFFKPSLLDKDSHIFTERFFFGEEDFNFCLRMNKEKRKMACVLTSKIYHKVSSSTSKHNNIGRTYIHYLNRFIDIRLNSALTFYLLWSFVNTVYITMLFIRNGMKPLAAIKLINKVNHNAWKKDSVTQSDFIEAISQKV